jgi:hypothetical protein
MSGDDLWNVVVFVGNSLGGAALALLAYVGLAPTALGEKFLNHHLERKLEALRHDQNGKIEELKAKLAHLSDRGVRSNEREYEALISVWERFGEAFVATQRCIIGGISVPDFSNATGQEVATYLSTTELSDAQKNEVMKATDKKEALSKILQLRQIHEAQVAIYETHALLRKRGIFIPPTIKQSFIEALKLLTGAHVQRSMEFRFSAGAEQGREAVNKLFSDGHKIFDDLEAAVRARLHLDPMPNKAAA